MANRCGYVRGEPRLSLVCSIPENLPKVFVKGIARCKRIVLSPKGFPELRGGRQPSLPGVRRDRRTPDIALEADALFMARMMLGADLVTHRVGRAYRDSRFVHGLGHRRIAEDTGVTVWRAGRAARRCVARGWLTEHQGREDYTPKVPGGRCKCCKGGDHLWGKKRHRSFNAVYRVTPAFIRGLGKDFYKLWEREKTKRIQRDGEHRRVVALSDVQAIQFEKARQAMAAKSAEFIADFEARNAERLGRVRERRLRALVRDLQLEHPDWGLERVRAEAARRL